MAAPPQAPNQYPPQTQQMPGYPQGAPPPGQPGMPSGVMPSPKGSNTVIIVVVVVVVLVVAILIGAMFFLYVAVSGLGPGSTPTNPTIIMQSGSWSGGISTVSITSVTNAGNLAPTDLSYTIETNAGPYYSGAADLNDTRGGPTVNVHYNDLTNPGTTSTVSSGDSIRVTMTPSTSTALSGASLKVFKGASQIGVVTMQ